MIGERHEFVSMNEGVEKIADGLRNRVATFTREYLQQNARKANNHRHFLRARNKGTVFRRLRGPPASAMGESTASISNVRQPLPLFTQ
jgi:hypothetical protein